MSFLNRLKKFFDIDDKQLPDTNFRNSYSHKSYSQCGEDLIINFALNELKIINPTYLDIGAHHPYFLSNTALFYEKGFRGVLIEPDPDLFIAIKKNRIEDTCLNIGIGVGNEVKSTFYIMTARTLNTFSKEEADRYVSYGQQKIEKTIELPLVNVNTIIEQHFYNTPPSFVSLDTEGFDIHILKSMDLINKRPFIFCIETLSYTEDKSEEKIESIIDFMKSKGYFIYADTYINTIFIDKIAWKNR